MVTLIIVLLFALQVYQSWLLFAHRKGLRMALDVLDKLSSKPLVREVLTEKETVTLREVMSLNPVVEHLPLADSELINIARL